MIIINVSRESGRGLTIVHESIPLYRIKLFLDEMRAVNSILFVMAHYYYYDYEELE